jgi:hypothetical protein
MALAVSVPGWTLVSRATPFPSIATGGLLIRSCRFSIPTLSEARAWKKTSSPWSAIELLGNKIYAGQGIP